MTLLTKYSLQQSGRPSREFLECGVRFSVSAPIGSLSLGLTRMRPKKKTFRSIIFTLSFFSDFLIELLASQIYHEDVLLCYPGSTNSVCGIAISISPNGRRRQVVTSRGLVRKGRHFSEFLLGMIIFFQQQIGHQPFLLPAIKPYVCYQVIALLQCLLAEITIMGFIKYTSSVEGLTKK